MIQLSTTVSPATQSIRSINSIPLLTQECHDLGVRLWMGYGLVNGFIDHLYTPLGTSCNYSTITDIQALQITTAPAKPFSSLLCLQ
jgi:hypothetical protein